MSKDKTESTQPQIPLAQCLDNTRCFYREFFQDNKQVKPAVKMGDSILQILFPDADNIYPTASFEFMRYSTIALLVYKLGEFVASGLQDPNSAGEIAKCGNCLAFLSESGLADHMQQGIVKKGTEAHDKEQEHLALEPASKVNDPCQAKESEKIKGPWDSVGKSLPSNLIEFLDLICQLNECILLIIMQEADKRQDAHLKQAVKALCAAYQEMRQSDYFQFFLKKNGLL